MNQLNNLSRYLVSVFSAPDTQTSQSEGIRVNPIVSEIASQYEKLRNAMEWRDDEVVLRAAIERILKRRHFYGGNGKTIAAPLLRELVWARYFPDDSISDETVAKVEETINLYIELRNAVIRNYKISEGEITQFMYNVLSSHLTHFLRPNKKNETMANFMFHVMKDSIVLADDTEETRDAQVYIATRRAFSKDDPALIHFHLFIQYFGTPTTQNINHTIKTFMDGYLQINQQLTHPLRHKIFAIVKRNTSPFLILEEVLLKNSTSLQEVLNNSEQLQEEISNVCEEKYKNIRSKVHRAVIRSIFFLVLTKAVIALSIEGTFESIVYGEIMWTSIGLNIVIPPALLALASLFISTPGKENTQAIIKRIHALLFSESPKSFQPIHLQSQSTKKKSFIYPLFSVLWIGAFVASFGIVIAILNALQFNIISQFIFIFFLTIIFFLIYRIYQTAHTYSVARKQNFTTPIVDFFFMPIARVGRFITDGVSQVNIFLIILDFLIEAPFKGLFSFFEQWFMFMHAKREYLD